MNHVPNSNMDYVSSYISTFVPNYNPFLNKQENAEDKIIEIYHGPRDDRFKNFIHKLLDFGNIRKKYINIIMSDKNMEFYSTIFTSNTADPENNYQIYETLGDISANKAIIWYAYRKFPEIHCSSGVRILSNIKAKYASKASFKIIGEKLGFFEFISASVDERERRKEGLIEDCFEAFCGATEMILDRETTQGVGYAILYDILENIFDIYMPISIKYEDLVDGVTRLKELFEEKVNRPPGKVKYEFSEDNSGEYRVFICRVIYERIENGRDVKRVISEGKGSLKDKAKEQASLFALKALEKMGYSKSIPEVYIKLCQK